jgi:colanic acid biosynthesis glycosyl transferase WcaI
MLKRKPFLYNIRDLYPDMAVGGALVPPGKLVHVWEAWHRWALQRAACVIVLGDDMRARIVAKGVDASRVVVVRDGVEIPAAGAKPPEIDGDVLRAIRGDARFVLVHAGNLGFYGAWETLIAAAKKLAVDGLRLVFVGDGAQRSHIEALAQGAPNIAFLPFFPGSKIPSVLAAADAHVITIKRGLEGVVVPSKLYGILAAGKPIVAVAPAETDVATLGARQGFAVCCDPDAPEQMVMAVRSLLQDESRRQRMGSAALAAAPGYERAGEATRFERIVAGLAPRGGR